MPSDTNIVERLRTADAAINNRLRAQDRKPTLYAEAADLIERLAAPVEDTGLETTAEERAAWRVDATSPGNHLDLDPKSTLRLLDDVDRADRLNSALAAANALATHYTGRSWEDIVAEKDRDIARIQDTIIEAGQKIAETEAREATERAAREKAGAGLTAAKVILDNFERSEAQGYRSRDRQFAIDMLKPHRAALTGATP